MVGRQPLTHVGVAAQSCPERGDSQARQGAPRLRGVATAGMVLSRSPMRAGRQETSPARLGRAPITSPQSTLTQRRCRCAVSEVRVPPGLPVLDQLPSCLTALSQTARPLPTEGGAMGAPTASPPPAQALPLPRASPTAHGQVCASYPPPDRRKRQCPLPTVPQQPSPEQGWGSSWQLTVPCPPTSARFIDETVVALGAEALPCGHSFVGVGRAVSSA